MRRSGRGARRVIIERGRAKSSARGSLWMQAHAYLAPPVDLGRHERFAVR